MAGIRKKGDAYYCTFRFQGKRYYFTVGDISEAQALAKGTEAFAAERMNHSIQQALAGKNVEAI